MTQMTRVFADFLLSFVREKKIRENPRHLCHPRSNHSLTSIVWPLNLTLKPARILFRFRNSTSPFTKT